MDVSQGNVPVAGQDDGSLPRVRELVTLTVASTSSPPPRGREGPPFLDLGQVRGAKGKARRKPGLPVCPVWPGQSATTLSV